MVTKIVSGKNIRGILHYNEDKVQKGEATLILANGFAGEAGSMTVKQKYERFEHLLCMRPSVKTNALHISLNFHPSEKLSNGMLQQIALAYMQKIGFDDQPYLVYRHTDAAHTHVHIATTIITARGERMDTHNMGKNRSEVARRAIEKEFGLVPADGGQKKRVTEIRPLRPSEMRYGKTPTKQGIARIVSTVKQSYRFSSLAEFNAILRRFNVLADRGQPGTAMHERKGLQYSVLNDAGKPIGVPIKASALSEKPTLKALEKRFEKNKVKPKRLKEDLKFRVAAVLHRTASFSAASFTEELAQRGVDVLFRRNESGFTYGITFVDHKNRIVFNGSQLGKGFSAKAILARFEDGNGLRGSGKTAGNSLRHGDRKETRKRRQVTPGENRPFRSVNVPGRIFAEDTLDPPPPVPSRKRRKKRSGMHL